MTERPGGLSPLGEEPHATEESRLIGLAREVAQLRDRPIEDARPTPVRAFKPIDDPAPPAVGLVLAGGGAKGGYQVGAVACIAELALPVAALAGTSIGALNAAVLAGSDHLPEGLAKLKAAWTEVTAAGKGQPPDSVTCPAEPNLDQVRHSASLLSALRSPVLRLDFVDRLVAAHIRSIVIPAWVATFPALDPHLIDRRWAWIIDGIRAKAGARCTWMPLHDRPIPEARVAVLASAALPPIFPAKAIAGRYYRDGGYADNTPVGALVRHTAVETIIVIHLTPGLRWDHQQFPDKQILEIRPRVPLAGSSPAGTVAGLLDFSASRFRALYQQGFADAQAILLPWIRSAHANHRMRASIRRAALALQELEDGDESGHL